MSSSRHVGFLSPAAPYAQQPSSRWRPRLAQAARLHKSLLVREKTTARKLWAERLVSLLYCGIAPVALKSHGNQPPRPRCQQSHLRQSLHLLSQGIVSSNGMASISNCLANTFILSRAIFLRATATYWKRYLPPTPGGVRAAFFMIACCYVGVYGSARSHALATGDACASKPTGTQQGND
jgi:hypothetical protein